MRSIVPSSPRPTCSESAIAAGVRRLDLPVLRRLPPDGRPPGCLHHQAGERAADDYNRSELSGVGRTRARRFARR
jgi:hypothetical protein